MSTHVWREKPARYYSPGRSRSISHVTVHCTEGETAAGAASWFQNPAAGGSAHVVVDDLEVYRTVADADTAWHVKGANSYSLGVEIAGFARWPQAQWREHDARLREAARIHAGWCAKYGIPLERSTTRGYHSHLGMPGNDHTDPGTTFPWGFYLESVRAHLSGGAPAEPEPAELPSSGTLRLTLRRQGAAEPYVETAGWAESLRPMRALATEGIRRPKGIEIAFSWRGSAWRAGGQYGGDAREVVRVIRTVLSRYAPEVA